MRYRHLRFAYHALAGMALATLFVTMPFVARELIPILESMDMAQASGPLAPDVQCVIPPCIQA
jgi:ABC-type sulfate transport system permease subunit